MSAGGMTGDYREFLAGKSQRKGMGGFAPNFMPDFLFDFQAETVDWAIRRGRAAILAGCGLGKTPMHLVWAENVRRHTRRPVLVVTPLAVSPQTVREGEKFGIDCKVSRDGTVHPTITVTNYERLHYFNPADFAGAVGDDAATVKDGAA